MNGRRGISLITLIIIVVVLIILSGGIILTLNNTGIVGKSKETKFKTDLKSYDEEIRASIGSEYTHDSSVVNRVITKKSDIEKYCKGLVDSNHIGYAYISQGVLTLRGNKITDEQRKWAQEAKIKIDNGEEIVVSDSDIITNLSETEWTRNDVTLTIVGLKDKSVKLHKTPYSFDNGETWVDTNSKVYTENTSGIFVRVRDEYEYIYTNPEIIIANIDKIPPTGPQEINVVSGLNTLTVMASGSTDNESGMAGYKYSIDGYTWTETVPENQTYIFDKLQPSANITVYAKSVDNVGNESIGSKEIDTNTLEPDSNITITLSTEEWTKGPISATISCDNIPLNYVLQYKLTEDIDYTNGSIIPEINKNTTIKARLYYQEIGSQIAYTEKVVDKIDIIEPSKPSGISVTTGINTLTVKAYGSVDNESGMAGYQYKLGENGTWSNVVATENGYTFDSIKSSTNVTIYARAVDKVGNISSEEDGITNVDASTDTIVDKVSIELEYIAPVHIGKVTTEEIVDGTIMGVVQTVRWTKKLNVRFKHDMIPEGYVLQYKLISGTATEFITIENNSAITLDYNCTVEARLYNKNIDDKAAENSRNITNIDNTSPSKPNNISVITGINTLEVKAEGSTDNESGLYGYKYSLVKDPDWESIEITPKEKTYTFEGIKENTQKTIYTKAVDYLGNISSEYYVDVTKTDAITGTASIELGYIDGISTYTDSQGKKWTKKINVTISYNTIPGGYVLQYKLSSGTPTEFTTVENNSVITLDYNCTVDARLYNESLDDEAAVNSKDITIIDNTSPSTPTSLSLTEQGVDILTVSASGSTDAGCGFNRYQYSLDKSTWWDTGKFVTLTAGKTYTFYTRAVDNLNNVSGIYSASYRTLYQYTVSYNKNTTDTVNNMPANETKTEGVNLSISSNVPERTGYTFLGWGETSSAGADNIALLPGRTYTRNSNITLYAIWQVKQVQVTFMRNTSTSDTTSVNQTFTYGKTGQSFSDKGWNKTGHTLIGWNEDKNATTKKYTVTSPVADSWINSKSPAVTIYGVWEKQQYTLTFEPNDGNVSSTSITAYYGDAITLPTPTREKYSFAGWYTAASGGTKVSYTTMPANNQTLYAQWNPLPISYLSYTSSCGFYWTYVSTPTSGLLELSAAPVTLHDEDSDIYGSRCGTASVIFNSIPAGTVIDMTTEYNLATSKTSDYSVISIYENGTRMVEWHQSSGDKVNLSYPTLYGPNPNIVTNGTNISYKTSTDGAKVEINVTMKEMYTNSVGYVEFHDSTSVIINSIYNSSYNYTRLSGTGCKYPED